MNVELDRKDILRLIHGFGFPTFDMALYYMDEGLVDVSAGMGSENFWWKRGVFDNMDEEHLFQFYTDMKKRFEK